MKKLLLIISLITLALTSKIVAQDAVMPPNETNPMTTIISNTLLTKTELKQE